MSIMSMFLDSTKLGSIERRIVDLLSDGLVHAKEELLDVCYEGDITASSYNLYPHISNLRRKIRSSGLMINYVLTNGRKGGYQMSRRINTNLE